MSTALATTTPFEQRAVSYIPFGEKTLVELKVDQVRNVLTKPTKSGIKPTDQDVIKFMQLCKARELNPWTGDAFLIGYDTKDGPEFNLVTAVQALFKRAEANPNFDGLEQGVIVRTKGGDIIYRDGDFYLEDDVLLGGWARCHRKDKKLPFFDSLKLTSFDKGFGLWRSNPGGQISKCAQASVLRTAFPTQLGGLYVNEEIHLMGESQMPAFTAPNPMAGQTTIEPDMPAAIEQKPQTKSEKLASTRPKKEKAAKAPEPSGRTDQAVIPEASYASTNPMAGDANPMETQQSAEPVKEEAAPEQRDLVAEFVFGLQYCPTPQAVFKFRDTFCGPNREHEPTDEERAKIEEIATAEANKRIPPAPAKTKKDFS